MPSLSLATQSLAAQFIASMPAAYAEAFDIADAEEHARIVLERGSDAARVVVWRSLPSGVAILCVVTDDRPGLVALVTSAFLAHALDVRAAQIYCRTRPDGGLEAVDFFWLRNSAGPAAVDPGRLEACGATIAQLVTLQNGAGETPGLAVRADAAASVSYSPDEAIAEAWDVRLETRDFPGLLHTVARLLHQHGLEVLRCEIRTEEGIACDRFIVTSFNGKAAREQLPAFRTALLGVIAARASTAPPA
jgi:UTP:GlnB (protein PII) uridylyltransferase